MQLIYSVLIGSVHAFCLHIFGGKLNRTGLKINISYRNRREAALPDRVQNPYNKALLIQLFLSECFLVF